MSEHTRTWSQRRPAEDRRREAMVEIGAKVRSLAIDLEVERRRADRNLAEAVKWARLALADTKLQRPSGALRGGAEARVRELEEEKREAHSHSYSEIMLVCECGLTFARKGMDPEGSETTCICNTSGPGETERCPLHGGQDYSEGSEG